MAKLTPNAEQEAILDAFADEKDLVIEAGAGTGKTSTLRMITDEEPELDYLYLAFNAAVVEEAKGRFHRGVNARTAHSLAHRWARNSGSTNERLLEKLRGKWNYDSVVAGRLYGGANRLYLDGDTGLRTRQFGPLVLTRLALATMKNYLASADRELGEKHLERPDGILDTAWPALRDLLLDPVMGGAKRALDDLFDPRGDLVKFEHDAYLKLYSLSDPDLSKEFHVVLLDEAQDANPVIAEIVLSQIGRCQVIAVGDPNQAIYGFTGAVDAMKKIRDRNSKAEILPLTVSYRFGSAIAAGANRILASTGTERRLVGAGDTGVIDADATADPFADVDAVLARTNAGVLNEAIAARAAGFRPAIKADTSALRSFFTSAQKLMAGKKPGAGVLADYSTWDEFLDFVENDSAGAEYAIYVSLIDSIGVDKLVDLLEDVAEVNERDADVVVSTAHKVKGLEWDSVRLSDDFGDEFEPGEGTNLVYVAATRAGTLLRPGRLFPFVEFGVPLSVDALTRISGGRADEAAIASVEVVTRGVGDTAGALAALVTRPKFEPRPEKKTRRVLSSAAPKAKKESKSRENPGTPDELAAASQTTEKLTVVVWKRYGHHRLYVNAPHPSGEGELRLGSADVKKGSIVVETGADEDAIRSMVESHPDWSEVLEPAV